MEISKYLQEFQQAQNAQDHFKMIEAMQKFFSQIHTMDENNGTLLGIYSMAQQLDKMGMDAQTIKNAVVARVKSQYGRYPASWELVALGINSLLESEGRMGDRINVVNRR